MDVFVFLLISSLVMAFLVDTVRCRDLPSEVIVYYWIQALHGLSALNTEEAWN